MHCHIVFVSPFLLPIIPLPSPVFPIAFMIKKREPQLALFRIVAAENGGKTESEKCKVLRHCKTVELGLSWVKKETIKRD
jgi:hypothetical protein